MLDLEAELLKRQSELADRVGEPVLLGVRLVYDNWFEVEIGTFTDRFGTAAGRDLERAVEEAAIMLLDWIGLRPNGGRRQISASGGQAATRLLDRKAEWQPVRDMISPRW